MRKWQCLLLLLCSLFIVSCSQKPVVLHDTQDHVLSADFFKGKWIIINYWAPWCHSCVEEIPELNRFYLNNRDASLLIYGVNNDEVSVAELKTAVMKSGIKYPVLLENPQAVWQLDIPAAIPTTFIINPAGKVVKVILGPNTAKSLLAEVHALQKDSHVATP